MKCMKSCLWYLSLKQGAYLVCFVFIISSITIFILMESRIVTGMNALPSGLSQLIGALAVTHALLFVASWALLYGLCTENGWFLLQFVFFSLVVAVGELVLIVYLILERSSLPEAGIRVAIGQGFIFVSVIYSATEVFSLHEQWRQDKKEERLRTILE